MPVSKQEFCPVCHSQNNFQVFVAKAGYVIRCEQCSLKFFGPRPTSAELEDYYCSEQYRSTYKTGNMVGAEFARNRYQQFIKVLAGYNSYPLPFDSKKILDIGCGSGDFLLLASQDGWDVCGTEVSQQTVDEANQKLGGNYVRQCSIDVIKPLPNMYDVITCYHVIEHLLDPVEMLQQAYTALKPGGIFFLETPNASSLGAKIRREKWSEIKPPEHVNFFDRKSISYSLSYVGFQKVKAFTIRPQKIESISSLKGILKDIGNMIYEIAPRFHLGASLQAIATKPYN